MKARDVVNATATLLGRMSDDERSRLAVILANDRMTPTERHAAVERIATKSINRQLSTDQTMNWIDKMFDGVFGKRPN